MHILSGSIRRYVAAARENDPVVRLIVALFDCSGEAFRLAEKKFFGGVQVTAEALLRPEQMRDLCQIDSGVNVEDMGAGAQRVGHQSGGVAADMQPGEAVLLALELAELVRSAMPAQARREKQHPAKRTFQAIRIAVNDELGAVEDMLGKAVDLLNPGGRLAVITFHSLEDRIVKAAMAEAARGCTCPPEFPVCICGKKPRVRLVTRKPIVPGAAELEENPRARSAKLRVAEKLP